MSRRENTKLDREKTTVSLADFYAPTPDIQTRMRDIFYLALFISNVSLRAIIVNMIKYIKIENICSGTCILLNLE